MRYDSARSMIWQAYSTSRDSIMAVAMARYRLGADIQVTVPLSHDGSIVHRLEAGQVMSRVESLAPCLSSLMLISFAPMTPEELIDHKARVVRHLYSYLIKECDVPVPGMQTGRPPVRAAMEAHAICRAALYHHVETTWPYSRNGLSSPQQIRDWLRANAATDLDTRRWTRSPASGACWGRVWDVLLDTLNDWEREGLEPVARLLRQVRRP